MPNEYKSAEQAQEEGPSWFNENQDSFFNTSRSSAFFDQNYTASSSAAFDPFSEDDELHGNSDKSPVNNFVRNNYKYHDYDGLTSTIPALTSTEEQEEGAEEQQSSPLLPKSKMPDAEPMTIRIDDPVKSSDGSYITYQVFTMTALEMYSMDKRPVRRRFRDFVWLHNVLTNAYPACVIPPLPEKHRFKYMKGDRFNPFFIEQRRLGLQWFLDRIARHPVLQKSEYTRIFLESTDFNSDKHVKIKSSAPSTSISESIFGSLFKSFVKVKKPDEKFEEMKDTIDKFEDNLNIVEKLYSRIGKRQEELEENYNHFATSIRGLSALETIVDQPLRQFAEATEMYSEALKEMRRQENLLFLNDVHQLLNYCHAAKEQLVERDRKQVQFEELSTALQSLTLERDRILYPGKDLGQTTSTTGPATTAAITTTSTSLNITELMADKFTNNKDDRLMRLKKKIKDLQENVSRANDENNNFSDQVLNEYDIFQRAKDSELRQGLAAYADCHLDFYKKSIKIWENILPVLEQIQPHQVEEQ